VKTFKDLEFEQVNDAPFMVGKKARMHFDNGYGVSIVKHPFSYGGSSYTNNENEWEVAILFGNEKEWELTYNTPIANDVIGWLSEDEVTDIMIKVQEL